MKTKQAAILCGGLGTRLIPVTSKIPKCMVSVAGKPFLEYVLLHLKKQGIKKALLLTGYLHGQIKEYFGNEFEGIEIEYSPEGSPLGTGGALKNAKGKLEETFFLLNGDTYFPVALGELETALLKNKSALAVLSAYLNSEKIAPNNLLVDDEEKILQYGGKNCNCVDAGASVWRKESLRLIKTVPCSLEKDIYPELIKHGYIYASKTDVRFYDIGTFERLKIAEEFFKGR
ncbi:hypothetical protein COV61_00195 [Candidatus Micrarchaeota archaeon CG11_big_fil_rev_8_21_14_0_20_47_5]|nr:MAG: hypothetical protein AUJ17_05025 [Candidatus Micrarchaeota archaeon CG1_02_47_40]PIN84421.1 MAG: hypothetical protein COV61_00195 [Candidatus Micrarchaeota archaeon CG11_big_fil_rev_8_21_14_0_20_47_5]